MESEAGKNVSSENGSPAFRKCAYPYCRNMAAATTDYCEIHAHSSLLVKNKNPKKAADKTSQHKSYQCPKCEYHTIDPKGLAIHIGQKHKVTATVKPRKKAAAPGPMSAVAPPVTIVLTADEALEAGIALALADMINGERFKDANKISTKIFKALIAQVPQDVLEGES